MSPSEDKEIGTEPQEGQDPFIGRVFNNRFRVLDLIARGGLGAVYRAEQAPLGRVCAIKILMPRYEETSPDEFNKRFFLEASIASKLTHPNNVTLYDYGHTKDDIYFMAMELLEGQTLAQTLNVEGPMNEERATHIARQICRALREAHSLGVIHRDIKPSNIFLTQRHDEPDFVKVMDFGLVKDINLQEDGLTKAGMFMGSPKYMSPEQIQGQVVDARSDIYAVGVVLFEIVTGKPPFDRRSSVQTLIAHLSEQAPLVREANPNCNISPHMEQVIYRCIAKSPGDRFGSTDELLIGLKGFSGAAATATISSVSGSFPPFASSGSSPVLANSHSDPHVFMAGQATSDGITPGGVSAAREFERKARNRRLILGVVGVAVLAGGVAVAMTQFSTKDPLGVPQPIQPAASVALVNPAPPVSLAPAPSASDPVPHASAEEPVQPPPLRVVTIPGGATIKLGDREGKELCDRTPCEIPRAELPENAMLYIARRDYVIVTEKVEPGEDTLEIKLIRTAAGIPQPQPGPTSQPKVYKHDPY